LDVFDAELSFWETVLGLFLHNIPVFFLLIILIIAWKHELVGAIVFTLLGLLFLARTAMTALTNLPPQWLSLLSSFLIIGPPLLVGILFFINWYKKHLYTR